MFKKFDNLLFVLVLSCTAIVLFYLGYWNEVWEGGGDAHWHYYISKYSYDNPQLFLNHWGKPLFTFLSAPFSQFGFYGLIVFNILCGLGAAIVTYLFCKAIGFEAPWFSAIVLLYGVLYFLILQSTTTEPLFSLLFILTTYLFFTEKYVAATTIASFLIYSRSEGMFFVAIFAVYLLLNRKWKYIPLLATGFIIYSFIGFFSGHDFLWYFTENPYAKDSVYGHGSWAHFFDKYSVIFGRTNGLLLIIGIFILFALVFKNQGYNFLKLPLGKHLKVVLLVFVPSLVFFMFHVYAWAEGKFASAGLERVMASILPGVTILCMYSVNLLNKLNVNKVFLFCLNVLLANKLIQDTFLAYAYPTKAWGHEIVIREAAKWFKTVREPNSVVFYAHSGIIFYCDENPYSPYNREAFGFTNTCDFTDKKHFYYIWDSHFSEGSCGNKLESLKQCSELKLIKSFDKEDFFKLYFFEYKPVDKKQVIRPLF